LMSSDASIYIHCDWRVNAFLRSIMNEIFGVDNFRNEIIWKRKGGSANPQNRLGVVTDSILWFSKSNNIFFNQEYTKDSEEAKNYIKERFNRFDEKTKRKFMDSPIISPNPRPTLMYDYKGFKSPPSGWSVSIDVMERWDNEGKLLIPEDKSKRIRRKIFEDEYIGQPIHSPMSL
jgi:adenine-specific DNA-methyltransferase